MNEYLSPNFKNILLNSLPNNVLISLHTSVPTETGLVGELNSVGYARQSATLLPANDGRRYLENDVIFNLLSGTSVSYIGYWFGVDFIGYDLLATEFTLNSDQEVKLNANSTYIGIA